MKLTKIKLINWHMFTDNEIDVNGNLLITGDNGNGKSTLIDAIFYLLSGGEESKKNFNAAANDESERTLITYMRGKLGGEKKEFLRNDSSIITHIALEFCYENDGKSSVLGCIIAIENSSRPRAKFYIAMDKSLNDLKFVSDSGDILDYVTFKSINDKDASMFLGDTISGRRKKIVDFLQIANADKYIELLKSAKAFRPINSSVSDFVFKFLLKEDDVDITSLANELAQYQELRSIINREKEKIALLETFIDKAKQYVANEREIKYLNILDKELKIETLKGKIRKIEDRIISAQQKIDNAHLAQEAIDDDIRKVTNEIEALEQGDEFKSIRQKKDEIEKLNSQISQLSQKIDDIECDFKLELEIMKQIGLEYDFFKYIRSGDILLLNKYKKEYRGKYLELQQHFIGQKGKAEEDEKQCKQKIFDINADLRALSNGNNNYDKRVIDLISIIKEQFNNKYGRDISVKPLCECIEIKDDEWRNAIEGYLGIHRFDLIVAPEYFYDAVAIYDKYAKNRKIYGIGVVNTNAVYEGKIAEKSLFSKIEVKNPYANAVCQRLLGRVNCAESTNEFTSGQTAITKSCMVYSNDIASAINPRYYEIPFIGEDSVHVRTQLLQTELDSENKRLSSIRKDILNLNNKLTSMRYTKIDEKDIDNYWAKKAGLEDKVKALSLEVEEMQKDEGLIALSSRLDSLNDKCKNLYAQRGNFVEEINRSQVEANKGTVDKGKAENELDDLMIIYQPLVDGIDDSYDFEMFKRQFSSSGQIAENEIARKRRINNNSETAIKSGMFEYSQQYNANLQCNIANINDFIGEYNRIRNDAIANNEAKADEAFNEARKAFNENFISKLKTRIERAKTNLADINRSLKRHPFGRDEEVYQFVMRESDDQEMRDYARIITSGKELGQKDLFTETLDECDRDVMQGLFDKLSAIGDPTQIQKDFHKYLDYRAYSQYDIRINNKHGEEFYFSKIQKEKSGGEMQTPFYVIIGSCFNELMKKDERQSGACLVAFDEAFNNMDEPRTITLMEYYKKLKIQLLIVVPTNHSHSIIPYVDTVVSLIKRDNTITEAYLYNNG